MRKKTQEEFEVAVLAALGPDYVVRGQYTGALDRIAVHHKPCGRTWDAISNSLTRGTGCSVCHFDSKRKTEEQFRKELALVHGDDYTVLGRYINYNTPIEVRHRKCGYTWSPRAGNLLKGFGCRPCSSGQTAAAEGFRRGVFDALGPDYELVGDYVKASEYLSVRHLKCGRVYDTKPHRLLRGQGCRPCTFDKRSKEHERFVKDVATVHGPNIEVVSQYGGAYHKVLVRHRPCGREWLIVAHQLLRGNGCARCSGSYHPTQEEFEERVWSLVGDEYVFEELYTLGHHPTVIRHNIEGCGHVYRVAPTMFFSGNRCPRCAGNLKITEDEFRQRVNALGGGAYELIGPFTDKEAPVRLLHKDPDCNREFTITARAFLYANSRCPHHRGSRGHRAVREVLLTLGIRFVEEKRFPDCRDRKRLAFDFALPLKSGQWALIEYDGEQHFKPTRWRSNTSSDPHTEWLNLVKRDRIKDDYCKRKGYRILRLNPEALAGGVDSRVSDFINMLGD